MFTLTELIDALESARTATVPDAYTDVWVDGDAGQAVGVVDVITDSEGVHILLPSG